MFLKFIGVKAQVNNCVIFFFQEISCSLESCVAFPLVSVTLESDKVSFSQGLTKVDSHLASIELFLDLTSPLHGPFQFERLLDINFDLRSTLLSIFRKKVSETILELARLEIGEECFLWNVNTLSD